MAEKRTKKNSKSKKKSESSKTLESKIVSNLVELQKVHTNLAEKFDKLSDQISELLALFEMSARSFAKNPHLQATEKDKEFLEKIDKLLEQNKTIAKGLMLMEGRIREKVYGHPPQQFPPRYENQPPKRNLPKF